jgi:hypothetical protein
VYAITQLATTRAGEGRDGQVRLRHHNQAADEGLYAMIVLAYTVHKTLFFPLRVGIDRRFHSEAGQLAEIAGMGGLSGNEEGCGGVEATDAKRPGLGDCEFKPSPQRPPYPEGFDCTGSIAVIQLRHRPKLRYLIH